MRGRGLPECLIYQQDGHSATNATGYGTKSPSQARSCPPRSRGQSPRPSFHQSQAGDYYYRDTNLTNPQGSTYHQNNSASNLSPHCARRRCTRDGFAIRPAMSALHGGFAGTGSVHGSDYGETMAGMLGIYPLKYASLSPMLHVELRRASFRFSRGFSRRSRWRVPALRARPQHPCISGASPFDDAPLQFSYVADETATRSRVFSEELSVRRLLQRIGMRLADVSIRFQRVREPRVRTAVAHPLSLGMRVHVRRTTARRPHS
ncbi:hypothetical protein GY45DRAFT_113647 [Cubamyces sp. BRFM 1775]|nr:hypothetical protein GY45DRAFT_113647 [Cubamyces sp. BRFM 1775]